MQTRPLELGDVLGSQKLHFYTQETLTFSFENQAKLFPKTGQRHEITNCC